MSASVIQTLVPSTRRGSTRFHLAHRDQRNLDIPVSTYKRILRQAGIAPRMVDPSIHLSRDEMLGHYLWVLEEKIEEVVHRIRGIQEAIRLLGCIQGRATACGLCTISET